MEQTTIVHQSYRAEYVRIGPGVGVVSDGGRGGGESNGHTASLLSHIGQ